ncbi:very short patch repair endonuclease [Dyella humi]|uniref:Very short patch repair endonuclease n=1 Tax=Dyella humi TaxID=1770547 RepID=A0ABW8IL04_9GAMM
MDIVDRNTRSRMMAGIRGKNTKPELLVRKALFAAGFRYRLHRRGLPGSPDIVLPGRHIAVFVHGCFWHQHEQCRFAKIPASRSDFWTRKLVGNADRDRKAVESLKVDGWRILVVWECATRDPLILNSLGQLLSSWISSDGSTGEIRGFAHPQGN